VGRVELVVGPDEEGMRLDVMLAAVAEVGSRAAAQRVIEAGAATVDGGVRPKRHRLRVGERVAVDTAPLDPPPATAEAGAGVPYEVAHEDDHLIVVDKPAGVVVHPAPGHPTGTLVQALAGRAAGGPEPWRPGVVHRLDRETSGLLVVAKSGAVHRDLQALIRQRKMRREYLALVQGRVDARTGTIDAAVGRDRDRRTVVSTRTDRPRTARTHFVRLESLPRTTLVEARLETGRTHQIRAHFAAIGHPVAGDAAYGGEAGVRLGLARQFLHAARLGFPHPVTGEDVAAESPLPEDLAAALEAARVERPGG
jgi:23S rRNA pseudouridine1911/1915/1917 synthase